MHAAGGPPGDFAPAAVSQPLEILTRSGGRPSHRPPRRRSTNRRGSWRGQEERPATPRSAGVALRPSPGHATISTCKAVHALLLGGPTGLRRGAGCRRGWGPPELAARARRPANTSRDAEDRPRERQGKVTGGRPKGEATAQRRHASRGHAERQRTSGEGSPGAGGGDPSLVPRGRSRNANARARRPGQRARGPPVPWLGRTGSGDHHRPVPPPAAGVSPPAVAPPSNRHGRRGRRGQRAPAPRGGYSTTFPF